MITVTKEAEIKIKHHLAKEESAIGIRVSVKKTGCSGYAYVLDYVHQPCDSDIVVEGHDYKIFVDNDAVKMLEGTTLDYQQKFLNSSFEFINPNENGRCGCGESFTV
jgi:iron-sulfur cluster assembly protein